MYSVNYSIYRKMLCVKIKKESLNCKQTKNLLYFQSFNTRFDHEYRE